MFTLPRFNLIDFIMLKGGTHLVVGKRAIGKSYLVKTLTSFFQESEVGVIPNEALNVRPGELPSNATVFVLGQTRAVIYEGEYLSNNQKRSVNNQLFDLYLNSDGYNLHLFDITQYFSMIELKYCVNVDYLYLFKCLPQCLHKIWNYYVSNEMDYQIFKTLCANVWKSGHTCIVIDVVKKQLFYFKSDMKIIKLMLDSVTTIQRFWRQTQKLNKIEIN